MDFSGMRSVAQHCLWKSNNPSVEPDTNPLMCVALIQHAAHVSEQAMHLLISSSVFCQGSRYAILSASVFRALDPLVPGGRHLPTKE